MEAINIENINKIIVNLVNTSSDKQLYAQIVENAVEIIHASYGKLFLYKKGRLRKMYYSDIKVKRNTLILDKTIRKLFSSDTILTLTKSELENRKITHFPNDITFVIIVPLSYAKETLGFLFLYFTQHKETLTQVENELLTLYRHYSVLALTKATLKEESQNALEIRDRFIAIASHELRTPLTSIHGYIQLLHARLKNQDSIEARWIQELYIESFRMTQLVKELLDVNRIKQGQFAFVFSEVPMLEIVTRALDRYRLAHAAHPFLFKSDLIKQQTMVVGDFDKLAEMVSGLLGNAVKFSKPGEKITVKLSATTSLISLEVKNTGNGIAKKDLTAILNGFYKPDYTSHLEGMGIGLLLAQHIIKNHRGKLKIISKKHEGTTVTVSLPLIKTN